MQKLGFIFLLVVLLVGFSFSQTPKTKALISYTPASFPGGKDKLDTYLIGNSWKYDTIKCKPTLCKALVHFDKSGKVKQIKMDTTSCKGCTVGFYNMLNSMPNWDPAIDDKGNPIEDKQEITFKYKYMYRIKTKFPKSDTARSFRQW